MPPGRCARTVGLTIETTRHQERTMATYQDIPRGPAASPLAGYTVRSAMQLGLFECEPDADVQTIAGIMADKRIHSVVVAGIERRVRGGERLSWGIVSDLDLVCGLRTGVQDVTAAELAATDMVVVEPNDTLEHAAQLMAEHQTSHAVVVDAVTGEPVGILSTLDVARFAAG
jgi:CBS domain-containing protein